MQLFRILADGRVHSGEQLGAVLGISRAAIWKRIAALRDRGVEVDVVPGKGYRLKSPAEPWSANDLLLKMDPRTADQIAVLQIEGRVSSTSDIVSEMMSISAVSGIVCLAEEQTDGRGRRGRKWASPFGGNFYCSIGWIFADGISVVEGLSLAIGVAVIRALRRYGALGVQLKWPNDLVIGSGKLGGILIELQAEMSGPCRVIAGVGLNLFPITAASDVADWSVSDISTHLGARVNRNELGAIVIEEVISVLMSYPEKGFAGVKKEWQEYDAFRDAEVVVAGIGEEISGISRGVNEHGSLILETARGPNLIHSGEVSLRRRPS